MVAAVCSFWQLHRGQTLRGVEAEVPQAKGGLAIRAGPGCMGKVQRVTDELSSVIWIHFVPFPRPRLIHLALSAI